MAPKKSGKNQWPFSMDTFISIPVYDTEGNQTVFSDEQLACFRMLDTSYTGDEGEVTAFKLQFLPEIFQKEVEAGDKSITINYMKVPFFDRPDSYLKATERYSTGGIRNTSRRIYYR